MSERDESDLRPPAGEVPEAHSPRRKRWWLWVGGAFGVLLLVLVAGTAWVLNTQSGTRWAANRAVGFLGGKLQTGRIDGTLAGPLTVSGIRFNNPDAGVDVRVARVSADIALLELFAPRVHVLTLDVSGVDVRLSEPKKKEEERKPFSLEPPLDVLLDRFALKDARVSRDGKELFVARAAQASGRWTSAGIAVEKLTVDSPDGNVRIAGHLADSQTYTGRMTGDFRWKLADAQYAGELTVVSEKGELDANIRLSAPFVARLEATLGETKEVPWQFTLAVPRFDPRKGTLPDTSIKSLAATLNGHGDLTFAEVRGEVAMNGKSVRIDPARVRLEKQVLTIEALKLMDPTRRGTLTATGEVRTSPLRANLDVIWKDVELPKEWVGQPLLTRGELKVIGSPADFTADGRLALGPPDKLSDIALALAGTREQLQVKRLDIIQKTGSLNANGLVKLKPRVGWQFNATAKTFDPGAIAAGWPGKLGFELDTKGELLEKGPSASLDLRSLAGTLRNRPIAGEAALTVNPNRVIAGNLSLRSGRSSVALTGRAGEFMNVDTQFNVASLDDWVPGTKGRLNGRFHLSGTWPLLAIKGGAQGRGLAFGEYSVQAVNLTADVRNPKSPTGSIKVNASTLLAAGFEVSSATLDASGDEKAHTVHLKATGQPLSTEVRVQGAREGEDGWAGTVHQLDLVATGLSPVSLRGPVNITFNPRAFSVSQTCLAGEQISACASVAQNEAGELNANYTLHRLPLGIITALAAPRLPLHIEAVIDGNGDMRRTSAGEFFGEAHIASASGRISEAITSPEEEAADALLTYENLRIDARLAGDAAQGSFSTLVTGGGRLEGTASLANLSGISPSIDGRATLSIPDLAPAGLFVPQLANVQGRAEANVQVTGTLAHPQITGAAQLRQLAAEVPQVGIRLHEGELQASMSSGKPITLNGRVRSGDGEVTLDGETSAAGVLNVKVQGKDFEAANIPGAHVIIAPVVTFERSAERMLLAGEVTVPKAQIDLTKLPRQEGRTKASADVVVIDDETPVEKSKRVPLEARITVILGKDVSLIGYGLNAKVEGRLVVNERPGDPATGNGEIRLSGTYKAYGQDLTIEQGRLLFAGQPLADPQVNLLATRTVDAVKAKLTVSGSAKRPLLDVSADPTMSQTQALSYLVTGKPLSEVGSGEGDLVQSAARSLGGAAGNLLAKGLGKRLGISEVGVQDSEEIGGTAFTVGQYLSPRLYLSYGVGLFEPGQVVTLRYRLSEKWSLEGSQGPLSQKAGINYRIEKR